LRLLRLIPVSPPRHPPRQLEALGRGLVALKTEEQKIIVSWRLLGTEPAGLAFDLYRSAAGATPEKLNSVPLTGATHFTDTTFNPAVANTYSVRPLLLLTTSPTTSSPAISLTKLATIAANSPVRPYLSIPVRTPERYTINDCSAGDLDGDGEYELIVHLTGRARDNSQAGLTDEPLLHAYKLDGTSLWEINLGKNIREGAHYTQFMVFDLDGDGRAELVCKTADGTVDGTGKIIGDANADYRTKGDALVPSRDKTGSVTTPDGKRMASRAGYVLAGPEFLTVFDGLTGRALATTNYVPARGNVEDWGDAYGNRVDRFLACVAYLDGVRPSVVMCRGYYTRTTLVAWDWRDGNSPSAGFSTAINTAPPTAPTPTAAREITTSASPTSMATAATRSSTAPCVSTPTAAALLHAAGATATPSTSPTSIPPAPASKSSHPRKPKASPRPRISRRLHRRPALEQTRRHRRLPRCRPRPRRRPRSPPPRRRAVGRRRPAHPWPL
jgi:hypothetical protein